MKKLFTKSLALFVLILFCAWNANAQNVTLVNSTFQDWTSAPAAASGDGTTIYHIPGADILFKGSGYNSGGSPDATTIVASPNYFRFGSAISPLFSLTWPGSTAVTMVNQYVKISPTNSFVKGGKITLTISSTSNNSGQYQIGDIASGSLLGTGTIVTKNVRTDVVITLPSDYTGTKQIAIGRNGSTFFLHGIKIETNQAGPSISAFTAAGVTATINESAKTITAVLPYGTNLTAITPTVTIGGSATSYSPTTAQDFSGGPVNYTATDGTNNSVYAVTLTASSVANTDATLSDLKVDGTTVSGFNASTLSYDVVLPYVYSGMPVISSTVNAITSSQVIVQASAIPGSATVTVTAQDLSTKIYTVNFTRTPVSTGNDITSFSINGKVGVITGQNILVQMHLTTVVTSLTPTVVVSNLATYTPAGGQDFTNPVDYVVTAQDGTQKTYTVTVQLADLSYSGTYPYITNFPSGYVIPAWMSSPTSGIIFTDPYSGSDKALWYDNTTESTAATASVIRFNSSTSMDILVSQCGTVIAKVSATGGRTYNLYINGNLANSATGTSNTMSTLTASPNLSVPTTIRIENPSASGGITLGYFEIDAPVATGIAQTSISGVYFDGQTIHNNANVDLQVFDATGRLMVSSSKNINMSNSSRGVYIVKGNTGMLKIVVLK